MIGKGDPKLNKASLISYIVYNPLWAYGYTQMTSRC